MQPANSVQGADERRQRLDRLDELSRLTNYRIGATLQLALMAIADHISMSPSDAAAHDLFERLEKFVDRNYPHTAAGFRSQWRAGR